MSKKEKKEDVVVLVENIVADHKFIPSEITRGLREFAARSFDLFKDGDIGTVHNTLALQQTMTREALDENEELIEKDFVIWRLVEVYEDPKDNEALTVAQAKIKELEKEIAELKKAKE